jgi:hypothetical protein
MGMGRQRKQVHKPGYTCEMTYAKATPLARVTLAYNVPQSLPIVLDSEGTP